MLLLAQAQPVGSLPLGPFLGVALGAGFASLLTPCVFPMIPVTVSYFSKKTEKPLPAAIAYALGIISTFAILGLIAAVFLGATSISNFAANPWVNLSLGLLFVLLSLNLFGLYEFQLPAGLTKGLSKKSRAGGIFGPAFMGATFALTSFTCTMPFVATLLASAATGERAYPILGLTAYGAAFALPFFLLALFPSTVTKLPKSGEWLNSVKPILGFIELAAAVKFFSNADLGWSSGLITREMFIGLWVIIFGMLGAYLIGLPEKLKAVSWSRRAFGAVVFACVGYLLTGLNDRPLGYVDSFFPPDPYPGAVVASSASATQPGEIPKDLHAATYEEALALAKKVNRPVFIDFTGVTCTNCRWMEKNMFTKPEVIAEFDKMVKVQLYTDRPNPSDQANQKLQGKLAGNQALPTYVLVTPEGEVIDIFEGATNKSEEFVGFLQKATGENSTKSDPVS